MTVPRGLRIPADPRAVSMAAAIRAAAKAAPLFILTGRALGDLARKLGGYEPAAAFLLELAEANNRPIGVNMSTGNESSRTAFIGPRTWSSERLAGWVAGHHSEPEAEFGEIAGLRVGRGGVHNSMG